MKRLFSLIFAILLVIPATFWLADHLNGNGDNTVRHGFPLPEAALWMDKEYYQAVEGWFQESLPAGRTLKRFNNWLDYHLFNTTAKKTVHIGIHGWLYPRKQSPEHEESDMLAEAGRRLFLNLHAVEKIVTAAGRRFVFTVVPTKAAIYPEYLGSGDMKKPDSLYRSLTRAHQRHPLTGFVALEAALKKAKLNGIAVYEQQSRRWNCSGAAAAANQLIAALNLSESTAAIRQTTACPPTDADLYRQLMGEARHVRVPAHSHVAGPHAVQGPAAVLYGDAYLDHLLPAITHAFNGMEVIDASLEPTFGGKLLAMDGDLVLLESGVANLRRLHLDLESLYESAQEQLQGVVIRDIDLVAAEAVSQCAVDTVPGGLQIRSSGPEAYFSLPSPSGSTDSVFRMLKLTFSREHQGRVTVRAHPSDAGPIRKAPSRGSRNLIIPLPFSDSVTIQINPSEHPGVFTLENAQLLSFYGNTPPPEPAASDQTEAIGDIYSGLEIRPIEPPPAEPLIEPPAEPIVKAALHPTDELPQLTLTDIRPGRIFQRRGTDADIVVTGSYSGVSGPLEARVVAADDDAVMMPWTVVDSSPENGLFTGILRHVPQGGWYRLQVRSGLAPWVMEKGVNRWGVGMLVACIGQSNMREWFYTGRQHHPAATVMLHRDGHWIVPDKSGNGALAMGNRLAAALKIPVGLLDYSVNGTGLTAKAEWGKGFWLDTGPESIYRRFIDGVNTTGGSVEYVIWMQGEADAARGSINREEYRQALERFVTDQIRVDIRNGSARLQLPFLMIPLVKRPTGTDKTCQWIREAQMDALETIEECHLAALSMDLENRGRQHLAPASYTALGVRTAQTILYLLDKVSYHRGPSVSRVTRPAIRQVDIAIDHRGGTDFTPWEEITGFEVLTDGRTLRLAAVRRVTDHTIRIELEEDATGPVRVRYLHGAHPNTTNPVRDNSDLHLPLEPFSQAIER